MFENVVLRMVFESKEKKVRWGWKNVIMENSTIVFLTEYYEGNQWRRMRWAGHVARMGEKRNVFRLLVGSVKAKKQFGTHRRWRKLTLIRMVKKKGEMARIRFSWLLRPRYWTFGFRKMLTVFWQKIVSFSRRICCMGFSSLFVVCLLLVGWTFRRWIGQCVFRSVG